VDGGGLGKRRGEWLLKGAAGGSVCMNFQEKLWRALTKTAKDMGKRKEPNQKTRADRAE